MGLLDGLDRWKGRTALVTGASAGIGVATAEAFARAGLNLVLAARREERLNALAQRLSALGVEVLPVPCDLSDESQILKLFDALKQWGRGLHVLVNNAGYNVRQGLAEGTTEVWQRIFDVNMLALSICTREALKIMDPQEEAAILNISSISAHVLMPGSGTGMYTASKFAVRAYTETLRGELTLAGRKIKLGCIAPGTVDTEMREAAGRGATVDVGPRNFTPLKASDIADAALYVLASAPNVQVNEIIIRPMGQPI